MIQWERAVQPGPSHLAMEAALVFAQRFVADWVVVQAWITRL